MTRTTGTFLQISIARIFLAVVIFSGLVMTEDDCEPKFQYDNTGTGSHSHVLAFGQGKWNGKLKRLSPNYNYVIMSPLVKGSNSTYLRAPDVVGYYPEYNRWTNLDKAGKKFIGLCGTPDAKLQHLEPVIFRSTDEQEQFEKLIVKLKSENNDFFTVNAKTPTQERHWSFATGEFRRTDGVLVDPETNTTISYNGFHYADEFFPKWNGNNDIVEAPFYTAFHCRYWLDNDKLFRCGLTLIEESDPVIPICRYRTNSTCYKQITYSEGEEDFVDKEWMIGKRTYSGYKKQKSFSEAAAKCKENFSELLAFTTDKVERDAAVAAAKEYYESVTKTPWELASSCILTSGKFGSINFSRAVCIRDLTFETNSTTFPVLENPFYDLFGDKARKGVYSIYGDVFAEEYEVNHTSPTKDTPAKQIECCGLTSKSGLLPIHCSMYGYFMCSRGQYPWELVNTKRNDSLECECGKQQAVSGNDGTVEQPWVALLYFRFKAFSREVPALEFKTCAGTVINNNMILTSASCALNKDIAMSKGATIKAATADKVIIALNTKTQKSGVEHDKPLMLTGTVSQVHPEFFKQYKKGETKNLNWEENVALVKIDEKQTLDFSDSAKIKIKPACVADIGKQNLKELYGKKAKVTGWSEEKIGDMRTYQSKFVNIDDCKKYENQQTGDFTYTITETLLCHEVTDNMNHLTKKDGGAPMYVEHPEGKWQVIGTASSHSSVGGNKVLSLFTDVSKFANFINYVAEKEGAKWCNK